MRYTRTMTTTRTATFAGQTFTASRKATAFVSFYSRTDSPESFLTVEHRSETAAKKGSWQSPGMKSIWIYRGYAPVA